MKIGVIKELKDKESRVALTPAGTKQLLADGHKIALEKDAGVNSGFSNEEYEQLGVEIVATTEAAWDADLIIKVKEPLEHAYQYFKNNIVFTYLHLAGVSELLTKALIDAKTTAIAYETVEDENGAFPLLTPMSAVAGNMAATVGAHYLAKFNKGKGVLLGNVFNERHAKSWCSAMVLSDNMLRLLLTAWVL